MTAFFALTALLMSAAGATQFKVVVPSGEVRPGVPTTVLVTAVDDFGEALSEPPTVTTTSGTVRYLDSAVRYPGVFRFQLTAPSDGRLLKVVVRGTDAVHETTLPVVAAPDSHLTLPRSVKGLAGSEEVSFLIAGEDLPPPDAVRVAVAEGAVLSVEAEGDALRVRLGVPKSPYPRVIPFGVRDARRDEQPLWSRIILSAKPRIPLESTPGSTALVRVGERMYGPFEADENGRITAYVDHYPGEKTAQIQLTDTLGNELVTPYLLALDRRPSMVAFPSGPQLPGKPPPTVDLFATHADGRSWRGRVPVCRTPAYGELPILVRGAGVWTVTLPPRVTAPSDLRVVCDLAAGAEISFRVPVAGEIPARLRLRVWPTELSTDFPVSELQVLLEDARGERLPVRGVQILAERGEIDVEDEGGLSLEGTYLGTRAADVGEDVIHARYDAPSSEATWVSALEVGYEVVPRDGEMRLHGRATDSRARPMSGVPLELSAGAGVVKAVTGPDGWATALVPVTAGTDPIVVEVRNAFRQARAIAVRGASGGGGPGRPDLREMNQVTITPGNVQDIEVTTSPSILFVGQRSSALVRVMLRDRADAPITDEAVQISVSEGTVGPILPQPDGSFAAEYTPAPGDRSRTVLITAKVKSSGRSGTSQLELQPSPVHGALGLAVGGVSNFRNIRPSLWLQADLRTRWLGGTVMFRVGLGQVWETPVLTTGIGDEARVRLFTYPLETGLLLRRDQNRWAAWFGATGIVAPYYGQVQIGDDTVGEGFGALVGFAAVGGVGWRVGVGEAVFELKGLGLTPPAGDLVYRSTPGGLAAHVGYRIVY